MQKITPCLWFDDRIEEAVNFYVSVFKDARILDVSRYGEGGPMAGRVLTMRFVLRGQEFMALNGGPVHKFSEAISFVVDCKDQAEVDDYWEKLLAGGGREDQVRLAQGPGTASPGRSCPEALPRLLGGPDKAGAARAMQAMLQMRKIVVADLEKAYAG